MLNIGTNGSFSIDYKLDGVYLTVIPSTGNGLEVSVDDIISKVKIKQITDYNKKLIETCIVMKTGKPFKIAPEQSEKLVDASASFFVSEDKMKASIKLHAPEGGNDFTKDKLMQLIAQEKIVFGIKDDVIDSIISTPHYEKLILIAEGQNCKNGTNGYIKYCFDNTIDRRPTLLEDGTVNYKELNYVQSVSTGQKLCEAIPNILSTPGIDVYGKESKGVDGKPAVIPKGKNTEITSDGKFLISLIEGSVQIIDDKVSVFQQFVVPNHVDITTGNIYFIGSVLVKGNVSTGYTIEAQGDIEVEGFVEGAILKAGGNVIVKNGISGMGKGLVIAGNDVITKRIENSNIQAKRRIQAEVIMHSQIRAGEKVELIGIKGLLVGGMCRAGQEVSAKVIGSEMSTNTEIEVGVDPTAKERYIQLRSDLKLIEGDITKTEQVVNLLSKLEFAGQLSSDKKDMLEKSKNTLLKLFDTKEMWNIEFKELEEKIKEDDKGKIRVSSIIYPGAKVSIGTASMYIKDVQKSCNFHRNGLDVCIGPY
jgi:uncharacterized protein (DUF342 family)